VRELDLSPEQLSIEFMGPPAKLDGTSIEALARECDIAPFVKVHPAGTRREAAAFLAAATMLVNLSQDSHHAIPSKVFEYLRFQAWLLALAEPGSATEQVLRGTSADVVAPEDVEAIAETLRTRIREHRAGGSPPAPSSHEGLSRRAQGARLFDAIDAVIERPQAVDPLQRATSGARLPAKSDPT
jgi:hypothetical protein